MNKNRVSLLYLGFHKEIAIHFKNNYKNINEPISIPRDHLNILFELFQFIDSLLKYFLVYETNIIFE